MNARQISVSLLGTFLSFSILIQTNAFAGKRSVCRHLMAIGIQIDPEWSVTPPTDSVRRTFAFDDRGARNYLTKDPVQLPISLQKIFSYFSRHRRTHEKWTFKVSTFSAYYARIRDFIRLEALETNEAKVIAGLYEGVEGLPDILFPNGRLFITVDEQPTFDPDLLSKSATPVTALLASKPEYLTLPYTKSVKDVENGPQILAAMAEMIPHIRFRRLTLISIPNDLLPSGKQAIHFMLTYDTGPQTEVKYHLHLNTHIGSADVFMRSWAYRVLSEHVPDVIVEKAGFGGAPPDTEQIFADWLFSKDGTLITDRPWPHSTDPRLAAKSNLFGGYKPTQNNLLSLKIPKRFGVSNEVNIVKYRKTK